MNKLPKILEDYLETTGQLDSGHLFPSEAHLLKEAEWQLYQTTQEGSAAYGYHHMQKKALANFVKRLQEKGVEPKHDYWFDDPFVSSKQTHKEIVDSLYVLNKWCKDIRNSRRVLKNLLFDDFSLKKKGSWREGCDAFWAFCRRNSLTENSFRVESDLFGSKGFGQDALHMARAYVAFRLREDEELVIRDIEGDSVDEQWLEAELDKVQEDAESELERIERVYELAHEELAELRDLQQRLYLIKSAVLDCLPIEPCGYHQIKPFDNVLEYYEIDGFGFHRPLNLVASEVDSEVRHLDDFSTTSEKVASVAYLSNEAALKVLSDYLIGHRINLDDFQTEVKYSVEWV